MCKQNIWFLLTHSLVSNSTRCICYTLQLCWLYWTVFICHILGLIICFLNKCYTVIQLVFKLVYYSIMLIKEMGAWKMWFAIKMCAPISGGVGRERQSVTTWPVVAPTTYQRWNTFSPLSVVIRFITISQGREAGQRSKEIMFDKPFFLNWFQQTLNLLLL